MPINDNRNRPFTKDMVDVSPNEAGVYVLFQGDEVIYYGESHDGTIRDRLRSHQSGAAGPCTQRATHFRCGVCNDPEAIEVKLLEGFKAKYGRLPRCNRQIG